jgi:hypothetical protein
MTSHFEGQQEANRRASNANPSMSGISFGQTFMCKGCHQPRKKVGRKPVIKGCSKAGYFCADCVSERAA